MNRKNIINEIDREEYENVIMINKSNDMTHCWSINSLPEGSPVDISEFTWEDIEEIYGAFKDGNATFLYGKLNDGRYFVACDDVDYTFSSNHLYFAECLMDIEYYGLGDTERKRFNIDLNDHLHC